MSEYVMVPREPTEAMISAGMSEIDWCRDEQVQDKFRPFVKLNQDGTAYSGTSPGEDVQDAYRAMLAAAPAPQGIGRDAEFEVHQGEDMVAGCSGPRDRALAEAMHYAAVYGQDGPVTVYEVTRTPVSLSEPPEQGQG